jgi:hypothetical protein
MLARESVSSFRAAGGGARACAHRGCSWCSRRGPHIYSRGAGICDRHRRRKHRWGPHGRYIWLVSALGADPPLPHSLESKTCDRQFARWVPNLRVFIAIVAAALHIAVTLVVRSTTPRKRPAAADLLLLYSRESKTCDRHSRHKHEGVSESQDPKPQPACGRTPPASIFAREQNL